MRLTRATLDALRVGFETTFQEAFTTVPTLRAAIVEPVTSTTGENVYGWLGELPGMREWIGPRVVHGLTENEYRLKNREFELTIGVQRTHIEDDNLGNYTPKFRIMGRSAARWQEDLAWDALKAGFVAEGYDGQPFFDTAHPVVAANGAIQPVSNMQAGAGPTWYLMATNEIVKPLIEQTRKAPEFVARDKLDDDNVFFNREFIYGTDARGATGYGFWQTAFASRAELTPANYEAARVAISSYKADQGRPLAIMPNLLVVPPALEGAANKVVKNDLIDGGNTNQWKGTAEVLSVPYLA